MNLINQANNVEETVERGRRPKPTLDLTPTTATIKNAIVEGDPAENWDNVLGLFNLDPDHFEIQDDTVRISTWEQSKGLDDGGRDHVQLFSVSARFTRVKTATKVDVTELLRQLRGARKPTKRKTTTNRTRIVIISDAQIGKTASGGGTPELLERVNNKLTQLVDLVKRERCDKLVIIDPGDLIENCWNTTQQAATNDLSLTEQLRTARGLLAEIILTLAPYHLHTTVVTVPSNHGQVRVKMGHNGVANKPDDDYGIDVHRAVQEAFQLAGRDDIRFVFPDPWRESVAIDVEQLRVGVVHGHQYRPGKAGEWWAGQTHGDQPTATAHMLITGHYHNMRVEQSGAIGGKPRWIIQADAMDGGSDWFQNLSGEIGEPSILTLTIEGANWGNLHRITTTP